MKERGVKGGKKGGKNRRRSERERVRERNQRKKYGRGERRRMKMEGDAKKMKDALQYLSENPGKNYQEVANKLGVDRRALRERKEGSRNLAES